MRPAFLQVATATDQTRPALFILEAALLTALPELVATQSEVADEVWRLLVSVQKLLHRGD